MKQYSSFVRMVVILGTSTVWVVSARAQYFNSVTNVNVLREFSAQGVKLGSSSIVAGGGAVIQSSGSAEGSGRKTQAGSFYSGATVSETYTLSSAYTVGSWSVEGNPTALFRNASSMTLSGLVGSTWVLLDQYNPTTTHYTLRTFTPQTVTALKYVAEGPNLTGGTDQFLQLHELRVYMAPGEQQYLYGTGNSPAFNLLRDTSRIVSAKKSTNHNTLAWAAVHGADVPQNLYNSLVMDTIRAQTDNPDSPGPDRAWVAYSFDQPYRLDFGILGTYDNQFLANWQFWTSNLGNPNPDIDSDWVLQYTQGATGVGNPGFQFFLSQPGEWQHFRLTWAVQSGAISELELYGIVPEPTTALLLLTGGGLLWARRRMMRRW